MKWAVKVSLTRKGKRVSHFSIDTHIHRTITHMCVLVCMLINRASVRLSTQPRNSPSAFYLIFWPISVTPPTKSTSHTKKTQAPTNFDTYNNTFLRLMRRYRCWLIPFDFVFFIFIYTFFTFVYMIFHYLWYILLLVTYSQISFTIWWILILVLQGTVSYCWPIFVWSRTEVPLIFSLFGKHERKLMIN